MRESNPLGEQRGERHRAFLRRWQRRQAIRLVDQEGDRSFGMLPREARRRIKAAAIGSNDFGIPPDRNPCLYVAADRPT